MCFASQAHEPIFRSSNAAQNVYSFWVVLVFGAHMLSTLCCCALCPSRPVAGRGPS